MAAVPVTRIDGGRVRGSPNLGDLDTVMGSSSDVPVDGITKRYTAAMSTPDGNPAASQRPHGRRLATLVERGQD